MSEDFRAPRFLFSARPCRFQRTLSREEVAKESSDLSGRRKAIRIQRRRRYWDILLMDVSY